MKKFRYAILALIVSLAVIIPAGRSFYVWIMEKPVLFDAKNTAVVSVDKPGEITVWYYTEAISNDRYTRVDDIPDGVRITAQYRGQSLPVKVDHTTTVTLSDGERKSIFSIPAEHAGKYVIALGDAPKTITFAVTVGSGIRGFFQGFLLCSLGVVLCLTTVVLTALAAANVFPQTAGAKPAAH